MKYIIKKPFKPRGVLMALCVILLCFSCKKDDIVPILIDITGEPDMVIENVTGRLYYNKDFKMWLVNYGIPGTHDSVDHYVIVEMPDGKFSFEEGKKATVSGLCYKIPNSVYFDFLEKRYGVVRYVAGTTYYYIKVTDLNFEN